VQEATHLQEKGVLTMHEVWVTGAGIVSALGAGLKAHTSAMVDSKTGLSEHDFFRGEPPDPCICGMVPQEVLVQDIVESAPNRADLLLELAVLQSLQAAGLAAPVHGDIIAGTTLGNMQGGTRYYQGIREKKNPDVALVKHFLSCAPVAAVSKKRGITGKRWTVASACGSASAAIGQAFYKIRHGESDCIIAGGFEALSPFVVAGFNSLQLVSKSESKPFDKDRDGLNPGEGAAILVLESKEAAQKRSAKPIAKITGFGDALDAYHHTRAHPEGEGLITAITKALKTAELRPEDINHIHLHGTGTIVNDISEYRALANIFIDNLSSVPVCSTKPMTGHTFGASGALNAVFSILSINENVIPATLFHENLDDEFKGLQIHKTPQEAVDIKTVLSASLGFGGEAFALVITKAEE
jgi:3-oxoacyl-[acyl-carrier-protein] synthase-1